MLGNERRNRIAQWVAERGSVRVADLTRDLLVSEMTVRRDLDALERQGRLEKVHGGAVLQGRSSTTEPGFELKSGLQLKEKRAIARLAAELVAPGSAVALSAGTTTWALANELTAVPGLTIVTNSINVATEFYREGRPDQTVVLTGGVRTPSDALVGSVANAALRSVNVDIAFVGIHGMDERTGFTSPNLLEAETNRTLIQTAARIVAVADHTKWGAIGVGTFAQLGDVDILISDTKLALAARELFAEYSVDLRLASIEPEPAVPSEPSRSGRNS